LEIGDWSFLQKVWDFQSPTSNELRIANSKISNSDFHPHLVPAHFAFPNFGAFALTPACAVLQPDMPTMPATDHFSGLHESFTEWKAQVRAQILDSVDAVVPAEEREVQPFGFGGVAKSFSRQFR